MLRIINCYYLATLQQRTLIATYVTDFLGVRFAFSLFLGSTDARLQQTALADDGHVRHVLDRREEHVGNLVMSANR